MGGKRGVCGVWKHILLSLCAESYLSTGVSSYRSELLMCSG